MSGKKKIIVDIDAELVDKWDKVLKEGNISRSKAIEISITSDIVSYYMQKVNKDFSKSAKEFMHEQIQESKRRVSKPSNTIANPIARQPRSRKNPRIRQGIC